MLPPSRGGMGGVNRRHISFGPPEGVHRPWLGRLKNVKEFFSDNLNIRGNIFHVVDSAQPRFVNGFGISKSNVLVTCSRKIGVWWGLMGGWTVTFLLDLLKAFMNRGWADSRMWKSFSRMIKMSDQMNQMFEMSDFGFCRNSHFLGGKMLEVLFWPYRCYFFAV